MESLGVQTSLLSLVTWPPPITLSAWNFQRYVLPFFSSSANSNLLGLSEFRHLSFEEQANTNAFAEARQPPRELSAFFINPQNTKGSFSNFPLQKAWFPFRKPPVIKDIWKHKKAVYSPWTRKNERVLLFFFFLNIHISTSPSLKIRNGISFIFHVHVQISHEILWLRC